MMAYAIIIGNRVNIIEITDMEAAARDDVIEVPDGTPTGWIWDGASASAPAEPPPGDLARDELLDRFTMAEVQDIYARSKTDDAIGVFKDLVLNRDRIRRQQLEDGLAYLVAAGVLSETRKAEILG